MVTWLNELWPPWLPCLLWQRWVHRQALQHKTRLEP